MAYGTEVTDYAPFATLGCIGVMFLYSLCCKKASKESFSIMDVVISVMAGGIAGSCIDLILFPVDSIKTRLQASTTQVDMTKEASHISIFEGLLSPMLAAFPCSALFVLFYDLTQSTLKEAGFSFGLVNFAAATMAESTQALIRSPSEVVKQNMQLGLHKSTMESVNFTLKHLGLAGFYTGYFSLIMREIPFSVIQFGLYETLKRYQMGNEAKRTGKKIEEIELSSFQLALNGVIVGAFSGFIVTPFDVIKTKQMTFDASKGTLSVPDAFNEVWADAGLQGLSVVE